MRLAFVCDYLAIGGQERVCLDLVRGLDRSRFEPFVYAFRGGSLVPAFETLGVPLLIGSDRDPIAAARDWTARDGEEKAAYRDILAASLARDRIDAALVFAWRDAIPAAQRAGVRVLIEKLDGPALMGKITDKSPFDRVVCESATLRDRLLGRRTEFGLEEERIECILPGMELVRFDPSRFDRDQERARLGLASDDVVIGAVCRISDDKNLGLLIRGFALLDPTQCPGTPQLLIMGPDEGALAGLEALTRELAVADRVSFLPPREDVAPILASLDVFALTSLSEGLPTAILEALAMGLPIVATPVGSLPEVLSGNGFLLSGFEPEDLAPPLECLCGDPELRRRMGRKSRIVATRFGLRQSVGRYEDLVLECLARKPPRQLSPHLDSGEMPAPGRRIRALAVVARFKWSHIDYLVAIGKQVDLRIVVTEEFHAGAIRNAGRWGLDIALLEPAGKANAWLNQLREVVREYRPEVVHCLYYLHEAVALSLRAILSEAEDRGRRVPLVFECRDPLTTLEPAGQPKVEALERAALAAADGWIFVSEATRGYYQRMHGMDFGRALIVPHGFAERTIAPPARKLSEGDGRLHLALVGSARSRPGEGRYYGNIIRRLCAQGIVVHSHFHPEPDADAVHAAIAEELPDYHCHPAIPFREDALLSEAMSVYDLMGVFHELHAPGYLESRTLEICMPTKAVCGWLLGGIPVVCFPHYRGLVEWIEAFGMGFVVNSVDDVGTLSIRFEEIRRATRACLEHRHLLTHETHAARIKDYYRRLMAEAGT